MSLALQNTYSSATPVGLTNLALPKYMAPFAGMC
jgi:hypothetical protein